MDKKIGQIEKIAAEIENEKEMDIDKVIASFSQGAELVKKLLAESKEAKGRVLEIVRELDGYIEKELCATSV